MNKNKNCKFINQCDKFSCNNCQSYEHKNNDDCPKDIFKLFAIFYVDNLIKHSLLKTFTNQKQVN